MLSNDRALGLSHQSSKTVKPIHGIPLYILLAFLTLLLVATFVLAAVASDDVFIASEHDISGAGSSLEQTVEIEEVFNHLRQFQRLADSAGGSRAIGTLGMKLTSDYIRAQLSQYSELVVKEDSFALDAQWQLAAMPTFLTYINGITTIQNFVSDYYFVKFSKSADFATPVRLTIVESVACDDSDWQQSAPYPADQDSVVLIKRNNRCFYENFDFAMKYNVGGLLIYNDGTSSNGQAVLAIAGPENMTYPALFLTYTLGNTLAQAAMNRTTNTGVRITLPTSYAPASVIDNICARTRTGDPTQTIMIGGHSDSVPAGAGINDNGSGSAVTLALATTLARLYQSGYEKYPYRVKFCWWSGEEFGLHGSTHYATLLRNSTIVGERLLDHLVYLNYDMLGSPNYMFAIYDGASVDRNTTPPTAIPGSMRITEIYRDWFNNHSLPWSNQSIADAPTDHRAFLAAGMVIGGLHSGISTLKSTAERNSYDMKLGQGRGGVAGAPYDACYHKACDTIQNINFFVLEQMTKAAAFITEHLGRRSNLRAWLYPTLEIRELEETMKKEGRQLQKFDRIKAFYENGVVKLFGG